MIGGRDDLYLPGTRGELEDLARTLASGLIVMSNKARDSVSRTLKLARPESVDFLLLGFHLLDRTIFQIFGENGRNLFTDELLREVYRNFTCDTSNSEAQEVGRSLIERVNATQAEFSRYREIFPKEDTARVATHVLYDSARGKSDYLILEFVKNCFSTEELWLAGLNDQRPLLLLTEAMGYYTAVHNLLRNLLSEKS